MNDHTTTAPIIKPASVLIGRRCSALLKTGRRARKTCSALATRYSPLNEANYCGTHARDIPTFEGVGPEWFDDKIVGCDTPGHADRETRRVVDGVAMCHTCSGDFQLDLLRAEMRAERERGAA